MSHSLSEIAELAESIAEENIFRGYVNLNRIASKKKIKIIQGHYENWFVGELVHTGNKFFIHLNKDKLTRKNIGRTRFTVAHELGHFFIDDHRNRLKNGESLSHSDYSLFSKDPIEKQANHFASNLLMPRSRTIKAIQGFEPGLDCILSMKNLFKTSIECAAINYINLDLLPCILIKWKQDTSLHYSFYSKQFGAKIKMNGKAPIKFNSGYIQDVCHQLKYEPPKSEIFEAATFLSKWIASIQPASQDDLTGLEQTIKLGGYGGITFLVFPE